MSAIKQFDRDLHAMKQFGTEIYIAEVTRLSLQMHQLLPAASLLVERLESGAV